MDKIKTVIHVPQEQAYYDAEQINKLMKECVPKFEANTPSFGVPMIFGTGGEGSVQDFEKIFFNNKDEFRGKDFKHTVYYLTRQEIVDRYGELLTEEEIEEIEKININ